VKVPATSANLGPGFDALSLALKLYLTVSVTVSPSQDATTTSQLSNNTNLYDRISITYKGYKEENVSIDPRINLLTTTIIHVIEKSKANISSLSTQSDILLSVHNDIPLGKGVGSSGAAIVAGCLIANELCDLKLDRIGIMKYALEIEHHPDNISASIAGGFVVSCVDIISGEPFMVSTPISSHLKAVLVIPEIEKVGGTQSARSVLPSSYTKSDVIYNIQRTSLLTSLLTKKYESIEELQKISSVFAVAMQDKLHQPYRQNLIPGLSEILSIPATSCPPGLLGICMSGAGPSVLALARGDDEELVRIGDVILARFKAQGVNGEIKILEFDREGSSCTSL